MNNTVDLDDSLFDFFDDEDVGTRIVLKLIKNGFVDRKSFLNVNANQLKNKLKLNDTDFEHLVCMLSKYNIFFKE